MILRDSKYYLGEGIFQDDFVTFCNQLIPDEGQAETYHGELLRNVTNLLYSFENHSYPPLIKNEVEFIVGNRIEIFKALREWSKKIDLTLLHKLFFDFDKYLRKCKQKPYSLYQIENSTLDTAYGIDILIDGVILYCKNWIKIEQK